ncbi:MAG: CoA transferase, partial [Acidimicrobiales bacterium]|nr:CoA transferase [Acidimicrobiales bacterium]
NEREWVRLCNEVLEAPDMAVDPRFDSNLVRVQNRAELESRLGEIVSSLSRDEFQSRLQSASIAFGTVSDLDDLSSHAALRRRKVISSSGIAAALPAHPVRFVDMAHGSAPQVPAVGQHSEAIRAEFAPTATGT